MYGGRLVEEAPSEELTRDRAHPYTRHLYASIPILARSAAAAAIINRAAGVRPPDSEPMASASRPLVGASASRAERGASAPMASTPTALESQAPAAQPQAPEPAACPVHGDSCPEERVGLRRIGMEHFIQCQG
jgi:ABC-type glutathione transport system ATPase component